MSPVANATPGLDRWLNPLLADLPGLAVVDAHTHIGTDCDGTICEPPELLAALDTLGARAVSFPLRAEGGYSSANDLVLHAAAASGDRLVAFCRLDPHADPLAEGARAIAAGAQGIKLHPRSDSFTLAHPGVEAVFGLAHEHGLPILIHAGRGIAPIGADTLRLAAEYPRASVILAHAGVTDLAWIADVLEEHPNVLFDTAWWNPADLLALFTLVPAGRILFGSDAPFGHPALNALITLRCARAAGLGDEPIRGVMGEQLDRLLAGEPLDDYGPGPGAGRLRRDVLLERVSTYLSYGWGIALAGGTIDSPHSLARTALDVSARHPLRETFDEIRLALDLPPIGPLGLGGLAIAATLAATSDLDRASRETRCQSTIRT
ncbi:MAG TPA: amidohydrolase family protein [Solirubrobacteraceae bacterium]|nr:amidohydrolase family protein [Solirubrobacteraceae bacterium]